MERREKFVPVPNEPAELALHWPDGKIVDGRFGQQVMYSLDYPEGHVMFLDLAVAQKINMLELQPGERFVLCKRSSGVKGQPVRWDVWLSPESEKMRAARGIPAPSRPAPVAEEPESDLARDLRESIAVATMRRAELSKAPVSQTQPSGTGTDGPSVAHKLQPVPQRALQQALPIKATYGAAMTEFLLMAGRATREAERILGADGGSVRFDSRDVAALATTCLIQAAKDGLISWRPGEVL